MWSRRTSEREGKSESERKRERERKRARERERERDRKRERAHRPSAPSGGVSAQNNPTRATNGTCCVCSIDLHFFVLVRLNLNFLKDVRWRQAILHRAAPIFLLHSTLRCPTPHILQPQEATSTDLLTNYRHLDPSPYALPRKCGAIRQPSD